MWARAVPLLLLLPVESRLTVAPAFTGREKISAARVLPLARKWLSLGARGRRARMKAAMGGESGRWRDLRTCGGGFPKDCEGGGETIEED